MAGGSLLGAAPRADCDPPLPKAGSVDDEDDVDPNEEGTEE